MSEKSDVRLVVCSFCVQVMTVVDSDFFSKGSVIVILGADSKFCEFVDLGLLVAVYVW